MWEFYLASSENVSFRKQKPDELPDQLTESVKVRGAAFLTRRTTSWNEESQGCAASSEGKPAGCKIAGEWNRTTLFEF